jgi:hypothetical protein
VDGAVRRFTALTQAVADHTPGDGVTAIGGHLQSPALSRELAADALTPPQTAAASGRVDPATLEMPKPETAPPGTSA